MRIKTFQELTTADQRTLAFTPMGLSTMGLLKPEDSAEFQQQVIAHCDLADNVIEGTRNSFERLRTLHSYGVLCYEAYTVAQDLAWLLLEQALRERFLEFHNHSVPLTNARSGDHVPLAANDFSIVDNAFRRGGSHAKGKWNLTLSDGSIMAFSASMAQLQEWARREGLLDGQRNKRLDPTAKAVYIVETKAQTALSDENVARKQRAALSWVDQISAVPEDLRFSRTWHYVLLGESSVYEWKNKGAQASDLLEFARIRPSVRPEQQKFGLT